MNSVYDSIIRNAEIIDGSGSAPFAADIGIKKDRIEKIGSLQGAAAKVEIKGAGKITCPGFIDPHTHCDLTFIRAGYKRHYARFMPSFRGNYNFITQGVTTVITGNCGEGYADIDRWRRIIEKIGFGTNVYHLVPHGQARLDLFGPDREGVLSAGEMARMKDFFNAMMRRGARGFSSGIEYFPGFSAPTEEFIEVGKVVAEHNGVYATHTRENSGRKNETGEYGVVAAACEALEIGRAGGVPVHLSHIKINRPFEDMTPADLLAPVEEARSCGQAVTCDVYPYAAGSSTLTLLLPKEFIASGGVKDEFKRGGGKKKLQRAAADIFSWMGPERILISVIYRGNRSYQGKTIADIAKEEGRAPEEVYTSLLTETSGRVPTVLYFRQEMKFVREFIARDYIIPGSDALTVPRGWARPHPRAFGTFPKMIREFVLDKEVKSLPAMISAMTSRPAEIFHLQGRGRIAEGNFADITMFDPATIRDRATYSEPHRYSEGIDTVLVNGTIALAGGRPTGKRGGIFGG